MDKEEQLLRRRFMDLAHTADSRGITVFSDFLNLNEQNIFISIKQELPMIKYFAYGGFKDAERKILCFCGYEWMTDHKDIAFPIECVRILPLSQKFSDTFSHRDFLGAVLNLGLDRSKLGDILLQDNAGYLFCSSSIAGFITEQLTRVRHTMVSASVIGGKEFVYSPKFKEITGTVSSVRLDSILSAAFHSSRSSLTGLIAGGKVFVNSKQILSNSYVPADNDVVSVRGLGKFIYAGSTHQTKKGRFSVKILLYTD